MMPAGRKEIPIDIKQVEELSAMGLTEQQVADSIGVCIDTFSRRKKKYKEFAEALKKGKGKGIAKIANALFEQGMAGQTAAAIFYLKNRAGWTDKQQHTGPDGGAIQVQSKLLIVEGVKADVDPSS